MDATMERVSISISSSGSWSSPCWCGCRHHHFHGLPSADGFSQNCPQGLSFGEGGSVLSSCDAPGTGLDGVASPHVIQTLFRGSSMEVL